MTMGVVRMQKNMGDRPVTGSGMDEVVETRKLSTRVKVAIGGVVVLVAALLFWWFAPSGSSQTVGADHVTISTVTKGTFDDFIPLRARVTPCSLSISMP
jgi:HlyD family secretion protein